MNRAALERLREKAARRGRCWHLPARLTGASGCLAAIRDPQWAIQAKSASYSCWRPAHESKREKKSILVRRLQPGSCGPIVCSQRLAGKKAPSPVQLAKKRAQKLSSGSERRMRRRRGRRKRRRRRRRRREANKNEEMFTRISQQQSELVGVVTGWRVMLRDQMANSSQLRSFLATNCHRCSQASQPASRLLPAEQNSLQSLRR